MILTVGCTKPDNPNGNEIPPEGALPHAFSVSPTKKVYFAKGNLQYRASTNTWRFAENQWDTIGLSNQNRSATYEGWIDVFCYGSSGYNGAKPYEFYDENDVFSIIDQDDIAGTNYDWGVYNPISNAGNKVGLWRTLTYEELEYLLYERAFIGYPFGLCNLKISDSKEIVGVYILPDKCNFYNDGYPSSNMIDMSKTELETLGAVFLPCNIYYHGDLSVYIWGSSRNQFSWGNAPVDLEFTLDYLWPPQALNRHHGGVRLVCDCN